ncbi:MAG: ferritin-like domain-containing protein [Coleofasciculaceae cyanobacterium SM2_3_26]|nr:ferritin-like domain-containing protein [Coleofasciculaceae cyanobacterium SM2_3_26]
MNFFTSILHLVGSGAAAYLSARNLCDPLTRPNTLAAFQLAESGAVPFLETLSQRAAAEGDTWMAEKLQRHASDERRHGQIFARALARWGKQVVDLKELRRQNEQKPKESRRSPFFAAYFKDYEAEQLKAENIDWTVFMASTYILELDACHDFTRMANVLSEDDPNQAALKKGMLSIANDERGHAAYLYEAMQRRFSQAEVQRMVSEWRTRKVNALLAMAGNFLQGGQQTSLVRDGAPVAEAYEGDVLLEGSAA